MKVKKSSGVEEYSRYFGMPTHDDQKLFELLTVGVFQVGLSWQAAASKLPVYREVFANMQIDKVAKMAEIEVHDIMQNTEMIRNKRKIWATITNARAILVVQTEYGSFAHYLWQFVDGKPRMLIYENPDEVDNSAPIGSLVAKNMKQYGFKFVGPTVTYMFLRAAGLVQVEVLNQ